MSNVVEERRFSLTNVDEGNNKFWNIRLFDDGTVETHWGLQGATGQRKSFPPNHAKGGRSGFEKQIRDKTNLGHKGGAYIENKVLNAPRAVVASQNHSKEHIRSQAITDIAKGNPLLSDLLHYLTDVNIHQIAEWSGGQITYNETSGLFQTTQGVITLDQIHQARGLLNKIADLAVRNMFSGPDFSALVNPYLSMVPQAGLVRKFNFSEMFGRVGLRHQGDMLDALEASYTAAIATPKNTTDSKMQRFFRVDLTPVEEASADYKIVCDYYHKTKGAHADVQHIDVKRVFNLRIETMAISFLNRGSKVGNVMRLWHGSSASNILSILKRGMIIPPASDSHVTGRLFLDGIYFSSMSSKSIRYSTGAWNGGKHTRTFMFLADVAMGREYRPTQGPIANIPRGYDSCFAKSGIIINQYTKKTLLNPEMVIYDPAQCNPVYLVEFFKK